MIFMTSRYISFFLIPLVLLDVLLDFICYLEFYLILLSLLLLFSSKFGKY
jgi:hypothetical protein